MTQQEFDVINNCLKTALERNLESKLSEELATGIYTKVLSSMQSMLDLTKKEA